MSDDNNPMFVVGAIIGLFVGLALMLVVDVIVPGYEDGIKETQNKAIEAGAGRWTVDPKTGKTEFVFVTPPAEKKP